jgi:sugar O-acyltransferase (sialic acid O-acetyltransferase NeuD family)
MRVLILGAGGHGLVVADILLRMAEAGAALVVGGYLDDNPQLADQRFLGLPVLGRVADLISLPHDALVIAIGDNHTRQQLAGQLANQGERFVTACHPRAVIAPDVAIDPGAMICAGVVVNPGSAIGGHAILNTGCTVDHHNRIGDYVHLAPGVHLGGNVEIGTGALVGIGATVMPQRSVGNWAVIGAGSLVTKNIPPCVTVAGVPARARN